MHRWHSRAGLDKCHGLLKPIGASGVQKRERRSESHWLNVSPPDLQSLLPAEHFNKASWEQIFSIIFYCSRYSPAGGVGRRKERTNAKYRCKLAPDSYNLHKPPLILTKVGEISSLPSKAASSFSRLPSEKAVPRHSSHGKQRERITSWKERWERRRNPWAFSDVSIGKQ